VGFAVDSPIPIKSSRVETVWVNGTLKGPTEAATTATRAVATLSTKPPTNNRFNTDEPVDTRCEPLFSVDSRANKKTLDCIVKGPSGDLYCKPD
jgi:hypothetical protein